MACDERRSAEMQEEAMDAGTAAAGMGKRNARAVRHVPAPGMCAAESRDPSAALEGAEGAGPSRIAGRTRLCADLLRKNGGMAEQVFLLARTVVLDGEDEPTTGAGTAWKTGGVHG